MAAPRSARPAAQAFVGPDGALAQARVQPAAAVAPAAATPAQSLEEQKTAEQPVMRREEVGMAAAATGAMAVDSQGHSRPLAGAVVPSALVASGEARASPSPQYPQYQQYAPQPSPQYVQHSPQYAEPYAVKSAAPARAAVQAPPQPQAGKPCLIPMWGKDKYVCAEHTVFKHSKEARTDDMGNKFLPMPDESLCTVTPPDIWMDTSITEMYCDGGVWKVGGPEGEPAAGIECTTAVWFYVVIVASFVVIVALIYKLRYDTESRLYRWWHKTGELPLLEEYDEGVAEPTGGEEQQPTHS